MPREPIPTWFFVKVVVRQGDRFLLVQERRFDQACSSQSPPMRFEGQIILRMFCGNKAITVPRMGIERPPSPFKPTRSSTRSASHRLGGFWASDR